MNIYIVLKSKPHNQHYLKRYYNFIESCRKLNLTKTKEELGYTEDHHICPRSMFPEIQYDTKNIVLLTGRQHFIAHWML